MPANILDSIKHVRTESDNRFKALEAKIDMILDNQARLLNQQKWQPPVNSTGLNTPKLVPMNTYALPDMRGWLCQNPNQFSKIRDIDNFIPKKKDEGNKKADPDAAIGKRLSKLMMILTRDEFGEIEADKLDAQSISRLQKPFKMIANDICQLAHAMDSDMPEFWEKVSKEDKDYFALVLEHRAMALELSPPGIHRCEKRWSANALLSLEWKNHRQQTDRRQIAAALAATAFRMAAAPRMAPSLPQESMQEDSFWGGDPSRDSHDEHKKEFEEEANTWSWYASNDAESTVVSLSLVTSPKKLALAALEHNEGKYSSRNDVASWTKASYLFYRRCEIVPDEEEYNKFIERSQLDHPPSPSPSPSSPPRGRTTRCFARRGR